MPKYSNFSENPKAVYYRERRDKLKKQNASLSEDELRQKEEESFYVKSTKPFSFVVWRVLRDYHAKQTAWIDSVKQTTQTVTTDKREQSPEVEFMKREYFSLRNAQAKEYHREYVQI
jgi:hypothetical protein